MQVGSVHEIEIGGFCISYTWDWYYIVEHSLLGEVNRCLLCRGRWGLGFVVRTHLQLCNHLSGNGIEGDQYGEFLRRSGIAQRVGEHEGSCSEGQLLAT